LTTLFLTKLLVVFVYPLGIALLLGAIALALSFTKWGRLGQLLLGFVLITLWIAATPMFANWLNWWLASPFAQIKTETLPHSDAVILLGGGPDSRAGYALQIYQAGKAPRIVISGGNLPWLRLAVPDAERMADLLVQLGAPRSALILESRSRTTRENAVNTAAIFRAHGWQTGLLVTSGVHMPRALASFRKVGLDVVPAATDVATSPFQVDTLLDILPNAGALAWTTSAIKEIIGLGVYRYRGWA
jgi:uncharacterized SAM-binding protein YcdF (DUF218 family)